jgi:hypothetical protein
MASNRCAHSSIVNGSIMVTNELQLLSAKLEEADPSVYKILQNVRASPHVIAPRLTHCRRKNANSTLSTLFRQKTLHPRPF